MTHLQFNRVLKTINQVIYLSDETPFLEKETLYLQVREVEGRIYPDEMVKDLPSIEANHPLAQEWAARAISARRIVNYLKTKIDKQLPSHNHSSTAHSLSILDIGCGNGWLSSMMARLNTVNIIALDVNRPELEQGARVFGQQANLHFVYGNVLDNLFEAQQFDLVLFVSSIQYFSNLKEVIDIQKNHLKPGGEIHIFDSPLYDRATLASAKQRTQVYYQQLGYPDMATYYNHLCWEALQIYHPQFAYQPRGWFNKLSQSLKRPYMPFPWFIIRF